MKRFLNCTASDFEKMNRTDFIAAIASGEGRVLVCETIGGILPMLGDVTNAEFAAAMGADIILLNVFDVNQPVICGLPETAPEDTVKKLKELTGRPIGINLEPLEHHGAKLMAGNHAAKLTAGRAATLENGLKAADMGVDFIVLTGNPGVGVTNQAIKDTLKLYRDHLGDRVVLAAGKMHAAGILSEAGEHIITREDVKDFADAGADIILMPAPGTVPGITVDDIKDLVSYAHQLGKLTLTAIGTSQEGADTDTIKRIALMCKMTGTDLHHLGDAGYNGMALPENILEYGKAIRGVRHTYHRMALSIRR